MDMRNMEKRAPATPDIDDIDTAMPLYLIVRDNDLSRLEMAVNERLDDGYSIGGQLFAVTPAQGGVLYIQPLVLEIEDDENDDTETIE